MPGTSPPSEERCPVQPLLCVTLSGRRRRQHIIAMETSLKADNLAPPWHKRRNAAVWRGASNRGKMDFFLRFKPDYP
jgi:hypothetical protein